MEAEIEPRTIQSIIKCVNFAAVKHKNQRRKDPEKTPYINHPIGVAHILIEEGNVNDMDIILAAILHDTVEDTETTFEEIENTFGPIVRKLVEEVTDDKLAPAEDRKKMQVIKAPNLSPQAKLIILADKLYNLRDLERVTPEGWSAKRVEDYFAWAKDVIDGVKGINKKLEDILYRMFDAHGLS